MLKKYYKPHPRKPREAVVPVGPSIAYIPLTRGQYALVDREDAAWLSQCNWQAHWAANTKSFYASRSIVKGDKRERAMHRLILGLKPGEYGDHIYHRTLDNRRSQLRKVELVQNNINQRLRKDNPHGMKGITREGRRWRAQIQVNGKKKFLGSFDTPSEAHAAYRQFALATFPEYAHV